MAVANVWRVTAIRSLVGRRTVPSSVKFLSTNAAGGDDDGSKKEKQESANEKLLHLLGEIKQRNARGERKETSEVNLAKPSLKRDQKFDVAGLEADIVHAVHRVAHSLGDGDEDRRQVKIQQAESELLGKLKSVINETNEAKALSEVASHGDSSSVASLLGGMKVDEGDKARSQKSGSLRSNRVPMHEGGKTRLTSDEEKFLENRRRLRREHKAKEDMESYKPRDLLNSQPPLGIFDAFQFEGVDSKIVLETWKKCRDREMKILSTLPPRNLLEDMVNMTERGILWQFPISNEQGIDEDELEPFHEHVFLEQHLEPWCPKKGPLRHFMELVCVGLSKNPHISAKKKRDHIQWYKDYFEQPEHKDILRVSGVLDA